VQNHTVEADISTTNRRSTLKIDSVPPNALDRHVAAYRLELKSCELYRAGVTFVESPAGLRADVTDSRTDSAHARDPASPAGVAMGEERVKETARLPEPEPRAKTDAAASNPLAGGASPRARNPPADAPRQSAPPAPPAECSYIALDKLGWSDTVIELSFPRLRTYERVDGNTGLVVALKHTPPVPRADLRDFALRDPRTHDTISSHILEFTDAKYSRLADDPSGPRARLILPGATPPIPSLHLAPVMEMSGVEFEAFVESNGLTIPECSRLPYRVNWIRKTQPQK
jgi:hypothetical protein